ncbi:MAG: type II toxin-antitoxin system VapC family toxin [Gemmatimonadetes bacterium]|nr:type II toxin-antitoxin system VapC family toxin [Gemmatimonadota bacterium]
MVVVDTSVVLAVLLNEPARSSILRRTRGARVLVAGSLEWEVGNALITLLRRRRLTANDLQRAWRSFRRIPFAIGACDVATALRLAADAGLDAYDAYAVETARAASAPLLTLDERQRRAAIAVGVDAPELS